MTNSIYTQAKEIQQLAGKMLYEEVAKPYTDIEEWKGMQKRLISCIENLVGHEGSTPQEEGEMVLAILMGYTIAVRNNKNIASALERAIKVLPLLNDPVLKCKLAVFCYGECFDEQLAILANHIIEEQKQAGNEVTIRDMEELLLSLENHLI